MSFLGSLRVMTKIEKTIKDVGELRDFYIKIKKIRPSTKHSESQAKEDAFTPSQRLLSQNQPTR
jgi:hypothetical protein